jgi:hypothetical protein
MLKALKRLVLAAAVSAAGLSTISSDLRSQPNAPPRPKSIAELTSRRNDNATAEWFLLQSPFQTVTRTGERVVLSFKGIGEVETPFMKAGQNAPCRYFGDSCMSGVVRLTPIEWYAYMWPSVKGKFWLCLVYNGGPSFRCFEAKSEVTLTTPERYGLLLLDGQKYVSQLPLAVDDASPGTRSDESGQANDLEACKERCNLTVAQVLGDSTRDALVNPNFVGLWTAAVQGDIRYIKLMPNGFGLTWTKRQQRKTTVLPSSYWMVVPRPGPTFLLCLTEESAHARKDVITGQITVSEPEMDGRATCNRISNKGMVSFAEGQTIFVKTEAGRD